MASDLDKSLSGSERLSSLQGVSPLAEPPCTGDYCSTSFGDQICKTCGRSEVEIAQWHSLSETEKKLINIKNAAVGYKIRQVINQEERWQELQKAKAQKRSEETLK